MSFVEVEDSGTSLSVRLTVPAETPTLPLVSTQLMMGESWKSVHIFGRKEHLFVSRRHKSLVCLALDCFEQDHIALLPL